MKLLHTLGHVPILGGGFRWMESEMQNNLVKHSVFAALAYLLVSQTNFMMSLDRYLSVPKYLVSLFHAVVFGIIMYVSSMFLFTPFLVEGLDDRGSRTGSRTGSESESGGTCPPNYVEAPDDTPQGKCMPDDAEFARIGQEEYSRLQRELATSGDIVRGLRTGFIDSYNSGSTIIKRGLDIGCEKENIHEMFCRARDGH